MSDIRFNNWLHQSGTGGVYQDGSGNVGIGTSVPSANLDVEGTINANTAVISGNLTVEGVLTYDDVTNIDSVGVVTARDGIDITSGDIVLNKSRSDTHASLIIDKPDAGSGTIKFYNNGSDSGYIQHTNAEHLHYYLPSGAGNHVFYTNGANVRLSVTNTGASVTGNLNVSGHAYLNDDREIVIGAGQDLKLYHDSATGDSFIKETGSGNLKLVTSTFRLRNAADSEHIIWANQDAEVRLYHDSVKKFETTTTGVEVSGATKTDTLEVTQEYPTIRPTLDLNFAATKVLDDRITFTRDGVGTYVDEDGLIKYASNNTPRFDHNPTTGESLGLLIEEARTNYAVYSSEFDNSAYNKYTATVSANQAVAPDGTTTADLMYPNSSGTSRGIEDVYALPSTGIYTTSLYVKAAGLSWVQLYSVNGGKRAFFNVATGVKGGHAGSGSLEDWDIIDAGNGWYRIYVTYNLTSTGGNEYHYLYFADGDGNGSVTANGTDGVYMWGLQVEKGSFPTSYIPTSGSTVTRAADIPKIEGTNLTSFYNDTEGTVFAEYQNLKTGDTNGRVWDIGNNQNQTLVINAASSTTVQGQFYNSSGSGYEYNPGAVSATNAFNKVALGMKNNDTNLCVNGTLGTDDTSVTLIDFSSAGTFSIGRSEYYSPRELNGCVRKLSYYNKRLPNAQLQGLTQQ